VSAMGLEATPVEFLFSEEERPRAKRARRAPSER